MNYYSEQDIREIVERIIREAGMGAPRPEEHGREIPVEISARHVHLTKEALEILFGADAALTPKRALSQPGQFLSEERVKLLTDKGEITNVAILGPVRAAVQVELSLTDARSLGIQAPIRLSGELEDAGDVTIVGPKGVLKARGSAIIAKAHAHMTPQDAARYGVRDGQRVSVRLETGRALTLEDVLVRVSPTAGLAVHIDFDEANAAQLAGRTVGFLRK